MSEKTSTGKPRRRASSAARHGNNEGGIMSDLVQTFSMQSTSLAISASNRYAADIDDEDEPISKAEDWKLMPEIKGFKGQDAQDGKKERKLGITWSDLTVRGVATSTAVHENFLSQFDLLTGIRESSIKTPLRTLLSNTHGCVKPGEMLLVLGRPGSGCTTLLKMLANRRQGYAEVDGKVAFGTMSHEEAKGYRGQIVMNTEEEVFFPSLTVGQTIDFATKLKVPYHVPSNHEKSSDFQRETKEFLLKSMGISHTGDTKVGNEFVRGVSGGERKRVSIIETLASRGSIYCWDNSTRGLDASTALQYTKAIRALTDVIGLSTVVTLYQAGNGIYNLFDKVLLLDEGKEIYYGPLEDARPFMESLGFICEDSANVADFLTGVTVPTERQIRPEFENRFPKTADAILAEYEKSAIKAKMITEYDYPQSQTAITNTNQFKECVQHDKNKKLPKGSQLTVDFYTQVKVCVTRQYQILWGDKATFIIKQVGTLVQALVAGSLFYDAPNNSGGLFLKGGALFFSCLFHTLVAMSEVTDSFTGRPVIAKHRAFAFFNPAAFCIAQIASDIPVLIFQVSHFSLVVYFMSGLEPSASAFFTYWIILVSTTICMTAMFRSVGAGFPSFDAASKVSGFLIAALLIYTGYMIAKPSMHPWFVWIFWINPLAYAFEALASNEFHGKIIPCVGNNIVPLGAGYTDTAFQSCAGVPGAVQGATFVTGDQYLSALSYSHSHIWRNFGIIWAFWVLFVGLTILATSRWKDTSGGNGALFIPREKVKGSKTTKPDEESQVADEKQHSVKSSSISAGEDTNIDDQLTRNTSIFTWKNLTYTVNTPSGPRVLLDNVQGWVKPGMLGALMGSSGAGKTTLLDVLAQRKTDGTIRGSILVDGRELSLSFQRSAGYCEQLDVHEPLSTVREALEFSALLRQSRDTPTEEKLKYVNTIIDLLELHDIADSLIGTTGAGLSVEQRKRLTIGVELVSKPSILVFLDEPTSGLDGQAAFNTVRFLRRLADAGQAVLVTIHQPSALLFAQFDSLLLLAAGGKTVYFGDIGDNAATVKEYFASHGAPCPPSSNAAEHMIDVVSVPRTDGQTWGDIWLESPECKVVVKELDHLIEDAAGKEPGTRNDGFEFALPTSKQLKLVLQRMNIALYRNTEYINNKIMLHIGSALFNGFTFWMIGDSVSDLQLKLFTIFNFIFVAPGVIAQLQPLFIDRRNIYEAREKKSKMYSWWVFVTALIVSEIPYLMICAVFYFACWYYTVGFPTDSTKSGAVLFVMMLYELVYTGIGQFIAAYAPNAVFASLVNPLIIGTLVSFCGVLVPYSQLQSFWRYWIYYLNPFNYLIGSMMTFTIFENPVKCGSKEFALFDTPNGETCLEYLTDYMQMAGARTSLDNPNDTSACRVCQYKQGSDYLVTLNLPDYYVGWRDTGIVVIFVFSSYACVYLLMKLRTKGSKKAE
jgi:ATP-binding cassette, subfamily G (WHITE), member 2, SNQ2